MTLQPTQINQPNGGGTASKTPLQLHPAPALVRGAFTRPFVDPLAPPLGRPVSYNGDRRQLQLMDGWQASKAWRPNLRAEYT
jgi:hypothetical protein